MLCVVVAEITHVYVGPTQATDDASVNKETEEEDYCDVHISWMDRPGRRTIHFMV